MPTVEQLFARYRRHGDGAALAEVFDRSAPELLRVAMHVAPDPASAEDLLQTTFVTAIEIAASYDAERPLVPWLCGILSNVAKRLRWTESRRPDPTLLARIEPSEPLRAAADREAAERVGAALDGIDEPYRQVLVLHLRHGLAPSEIADALGRAPATVRSQLARGLKRLRKELPVSLTAGAIVLQPGRGLAAVRRAVLSHAGGSAAIGAASLLGALVMKKSLMTSVAVGVAAVVLVLSRPAWLFGAELPATTAGEPAVPISAGLATRSAGDRDAVGGAAGVTRRVATAAGRADPSGPFGQVVVRLRWDDDHTPATGIAVQVVAWEQPNRRLSTDYRVSDLRGEVFFDEVFHGRTTVYTTTRGHASATVVAGAETVVDVELPRGITVSGEVVDDAGRAVGGAEIWASSVAGEFRGAVVATADPWGRFEVVGLDADGLITARRAGYTPAPLVRVGDLPEASPRAAQLVVGRDGCALVGRAVDSNGEPVAGALVQIARVHTHNDAGLVPAAAGSEPPLRARTDAVGRFGAADLPAGATRVSVRSRDHAPATAEIELGPEHPSELEVVLPDPVTVVGRVTGRDGQPLEGVAVAGGGYGTFSRSELTTGADGRFELTGLTRDPQVQAFTGAGWHVVDQLQAEPGQTVRWDPMLGGDANIAGRVVDERGRALEGWSVWLHADRARSSTADTDRDGRFVFAIDRDVPYTLELRPDGEEFTLPPVLSREVRRGTMDLVLEVSDAQRRLGSITGMLVDAGGQAIAGRIRCRWREGPSMRVAAVAGADGRFTIDRLPANGYRLTVDAPGHPRLRLPVRVHPGVEANVGAVRMSEGVTVAVKLRRSDGEAPTVSECELIRGGEPVPLRGEGAEWSAVVEPGQYRLRIAGEDFAEHDSRVFVDDDVGITIELVAATRQVFTVAVPGGVDFPFRLFFEVRDEREEVVRRAEIDGDPSLPVRWAVGLSQGEYRVVVETGGRLTGEARFRPDGKLVTVELR